MVEKKLFQQLQPHFNNMSYWIVCTDVKTHFQQNGNEQKSSEEIEVSEKAIFFPMKAIPNLPQKQNRRCFQTLSQKHIPNLEENLDKNEVNSQNIFFFFATHYSRSILERP